MMIHYPFLGTLEIPDRLKQIFADVAKLRPSRDDPAEFRRAGQAAIRAKGQRRQAQVLALKEQGLTTSQIASKLDCGTSIVRDWIRRSA